MPDSIPLDQKMYFLEMTSVLPNRGVVSAQEKEFLLLWNDLPLSKKKFYSSRMSLFAILDPHFTAVVAENKDETASSSLPVKIAKLWFSLTSLQKECAFLIAERTMHNKLLQYCGTFGSLTVSNSDMCPWLEHELWHIIIDMVCGS